MMINHICLSAVVLGESRIVTAGTQQVFTKKLQLTIPKSAVEPSPIIPKNTQLN